MVTQGAPKHGRVWPLPLPGNIFHNSVGHCHSWARFPKFSKGRVGGQGREMILELGFHRFSNVFTDQQGFSRLCVSPVFPLQEHLRFSVLWKNRRDRPCFLLGFSPWAARQSCRGRLGSSFCPPTPSTSLVQLLSQFAGPGSHSAL